MKSLPPLVAALGVLLGARTAARASPLEPDPIPPFNPNPQVVSGLHALTADVEVGGIVDSPGSAGVTARLGVDSLLHLGAPGGYVMALGGGYRYIDTGTPLRNIVSFSLARGLFFLGTRNGGFCMFPAPCGNESGRVGLFASVLEIHSDLTAPRGAQRFGDLRVAVSLLGPAFDERYEHDMHLTLDAGASAEHVAGLGIDESLVRAAGGLDFAARFDGERWELDARATARPRLSGAFDMGLDATVGVTRMGAAGILEPWRAGLEATCSYWSAPRFAVGETASFGAPHTFLVSLVFRPTFYKVP